MAGLATPADRKSRRSESASHIAGCRLPGRLAAAGVGMRHRVGGAESDCDKGKGGGKEKEKDYDYDYDYDYVDCTCFLRQRVKLVCVRPRAV
jgi:hypothetical protein